MFCTLAENIGLSETPPASFQEVVEFHRRNRIHDQVFGLGSFLLNSCRDGFRRNVPVSGSHSPIEIFEGQQCVTGDKYRILFHPPAGVVGPVAILVL